MARVRFDMSMSLDGFIAGPHPSGAHPLGEGGDRLMQWVYSLHSWRDRHGQEGGDRGLDDEIWEASFTSTGAVLMGREMYDQAAGAWGDAPPFSVPVFVLTHEAHEPIVTASGTTFSFVTDLFEAIDRARDAAGDRDVSIAGGATLVQQCLENGIVDDMRIHIAPLLLGDGIRLFDYLADGPIELERTGVVASPTVTHLSFRVVR